MNRSADDQGENASQKLSSERSSRTAKTVRGVLCVKCEHLNPLGVDLCETCKTHLFVNCLECGTKNSRVSPRCSDCGRRMHKRRRRDEPGGRGVNRLYVGIVLVVLAVAIVGLLAISGIRLPF
jgi:hypothetical protein